MSKIGQKLKNLLRQKGYVLFKIVTLLSKQIFEFLAYFRHLWLMCYFVFLIVEPEMKERISPPVP